MEIKTKVVCLAKSHNSLAYTPYSVRLGPSINAVDIRPAAGRASSYLHSYSSGTILFFDKNREKRSHAGIRTRVHLYQQSIHCKNEVWISHRWCNIQHCESGNYSKFGMINSVDSTARTLLLLPQLLCFKHLNMSLFII